MLTFKNFQRAAAAGLALAAMLSAHPAKADFVIADDLIVQGSTCTGLDCVNGEVFNFDTLILKENNLRIFFNDTSVTAGFPSNDWRLVINDSASGGANFFAVEDATAARQVFKVTAGAAANSIFVSNTSRVGLRTATPVLDLHINTSNTPGQRLEQNSGGGFSAQTWDIAGNEANFFIRDVTGGSRLPFRIRPGAPTSSIDISGAGNVGIGTASPLANLHVFGAATADIFQIFGPGAAGGTDGFNIGHGGTSFGAGGGFLNAHSASGAAGRLFLLTEGATRMLIDQVGNVGIGTTAPLARLHTTGSVRLAGVPNCSSGIQSDANGTLSCLVSSRNFKNIVGDLEPRIALANIMALRPRIGSYRETPDVPEHWLIAEDTAAVDPALVGLAEGKPYTVKTQNVVADLIAVVQQQQRQIESLQRKTAAEPAK